jgi:hypothetical protein
VLGRVNPDGKLRGTQGEQERQKRTDPCTCSTALALPKLGAQVARLHTLPVLWPTHLIVGALPPLGVLFWGGRGFNLGSKNCGREVEVPGWTHAGAARDMDMCLRV